MNENRLRGIIKARRLHLWLPYVCLMMVFVQARAQTGAMVTGIVRDVEGRPLNGVSVSLESSTLGVKRNTSTDSNGIFTFSQIQPGDGYELKFSSIGFKPKVLDGYRIGNNDKLSLVIELEEALGELDEVVVVGYGTQRKGDVTAAIGTFRPTEENSRPVLGPEQMLQGKVAGVNVSGGSGAPGTQNRVSVRGIGSLSANNEPLYVIDGIPVLRHNAALLNMGENMNPLALLNPNDIESLEVLKDAAAAAIYGSRATNGVIIITTKSGKVGRTAVHVNYYQGMQDVSDSRQIKMAGSDLYIEVINEAIDNYNVQFGHNPGDANYMERKMNPYPGMGDTDWFKAVTRTAGVKNANLSFSSGTEKTQIFMSGGYMDQEGVIKTNRFQKVTSKLNLSHSLYDWLAIGTNSNISYSRNYRVPGSNSGATIMGRAISQRPYDRIYKPDGSYYKGGTDDLLRHNPIQVLNEGNAYLDNYRYLGNIHATAKLHRDIEFKSMVGLDAIYTKDLIHYYDTHPYGVGMGRMFDNRRLITNLLLENTLNYKKSFDKLHFTVLMGHSFQKVTSSSAAIDGQGFPSSSFEVLSVAAEINDAGTSLSDNALESYFARTSFSYNNKYLLNLSFRADGSSKFSPDNRWSYFPSVSAGWNISEEDFWNKDHGTDLKLRTSYGATGNQEGISSYAYHAQMSGGRNYNNQSGIGVSDLGNNTLTWETATQFDAGMDLSLFKGRLGFIADYFIKNTGNLLYSRPLHATTGFTSIVSNIGSMRNTGWEFTLDGNLDIGKVNWSSDFNISFVKNKLTSLIGDEALLIGSNRTLQVGHEVGSHYVYRVLGIYQHDEEVPESLYNNSNVRAGDLIYEDINNDGVIDVNDRQVVGSINPKFYGGWNHTLRYNNFDLSAFFTYSYGNDVYFSYRTFIERLGNGFFGFTEASAENRWVGAGTSNTVPRAIYGSPWNTQNSTRFLEDGSFIRLRSLILGYTLPTALTSKIKVKHLRLYAQADNLFLWTKYSGMDPEVTSDFDPRFLGEDNLILPQPRIFNFGINLQF
ncbi:SusC/RagA family TonB-linked outer membrane protein [Parapedobacter tibetensis]|uniref:SusC/RagA family TonB-linked outer membrane protein n=1 Tax=Parapedobacter tibetensis TaxID=2972951 RepID=UPI00214DCB21|nr:TonB-dependent receptor [Parapedobacter tibetensis]